MRQRLKRTTMAVLVGTVTALSAIDARAMKVLPEEWEACRDIDWVVIGVVERRSSRWEELGIGRAVVSDIVFRVDTPLYGAPPQGMEFAVLGGEIDGRTHSWAEGSDFAVGDLLLLLVDIAPNASKLNRSLAIRHEETMGATLPVADLDRIRRMWGSRCIEYSMLSADECPRDPDPPECDPEIGLGNIVAETLAIARGAGGSDDQARSPRWGIGCSG